jgi:hypothetical protein
MEILRSAFIKSAWTKNLENLAVQAVLHGRSLNEWLGNNERVVTIRGIIKALFQKRSTVGWWVYVLWLAGYSTLAFNATVYAAVLGQDYLSAFVFFLVPALIAYAQLRVPTIIGWFVLLLPTVLYGVVVFGLFPGTMIRDFRSGDLGSAAQSGLLILVLGVVLGGLLYNMKRYLAEPSAAPTVGPATPVGNSRVTEEPPSVS